MNHKQTIKNSLIGALCLIGSISSASAALITNPAINITQIVNVQAIVVSDDLGGNTANFFGNASQRAVIEGFVDDIWAQAGIDINFLSSANTWNNTAANNGTLGFGQLMDSGNTAGISNSDASVLNMYFVNLLPGSTAALNSLTAAGIGYVNANGVTQFIGSDLFGLGNSGLEVIAKVVSHEIGHNLFLQHLDIDENLMDSRDNTNQAIPQGERLTSDQITTALNSRFSVAVTPVPLPPALILFMSGLGLLGFYKRKRT